MELFHHHWRAEQAKATLVLIHGTGEHHGRYRHVAQYLNERGYDVRTGDLPGSGRSPGRRGHVERFEDYLTAVRLWMSEARGETGADHPVFLLGHSLGGLIATRYVQVYAEDSGVDGLILSSPCLQLNRSIAAWQLRLVFGLNRMLPKWRLPYEIPPHVVSRDEQVRRQYRQDPYNYPRVSVRWFCELKQAMEAAWQERDKLFVPTLILQAGDDHLVAAEGVKRFAAELPAADKQFVLFPGLYHEIFNEPERLHVLARLREWLDQQTEKRLRGSHS
ncbi:alpha/beta hydrolase [Brevibacillus fulvus]|uniref:Lysophospholipase n=1 Tax=Brevibacillus fulvus TaxID=1125967 RepID=A0A939BNL9_9BACL|nr:alpha/beta hydrolase [Brevibacillus fulvus]MBM7589275.1 lysophospholipase [Brevibacillus fulvus]